MDSLAQMLTQPQMVLVFVSSILLVALWPLYQSIFSIGIVNEDLNQAIRILVNLGNNLQDEFYDQFKAINKQIQQIPGLRHAWRQFVDSMYFETTSLPNTHKKAYLSHRPSHYFNRESVLGTRLNLSQFFAYPNYLIGIGLTFTFIGLAAALHVAQEGLANGAGQQALKDLLAVASIKFISSIVGISSSLMISVLQRMRIRLFQQKLDAFCDLLEECTKYKSSEKILHDSLNEQRRQTLNLQEMPKHLALGINEAISAQLAASVATAFEPLGQEIKSLAQNFSEGSEQALKRMQTEFLNGLRQTSDNELKALIDNVKTTTQALGGLAAYVDSAAKNMESTARGAAAQLSQMLAGFTTAFMPVQHGIGQLSESLTVLDSMAGNLARAGSDMVYATGDSKKTAAEFTDLIADVSNKLAPMKDVLASLSHSLENVEVTASSLKEAGATMALATDGFKTSAALIERSEGGFNQKMQLIEVFSQGLTQALKTVQGTEQHVLQNQKELHAILLRLENLAKQEPAAAAPGRKLKWWK